MSINGVETNPARESEINKLNEQYGAEEVARAMALLQTQEIADKIKQIDQQFSVPESQPAPAPAPSQEVISDEPIDLAAIAERVTSESLKKDIQGLIVAKQHIESVDPNNPQSLELITNDDIRNILIQPKGSIVLAPKYGLTGDEYLGIARAQQKAARSLEQKGAEFIYPMPGERFDPQYHSCDDDRYLIGDNTGRPELDNTIHSVRGGGIKSNDNAYIRPAEVRKIITIS